MNIKSQLFDASKIIVGSFLCGMGEGMYLFNTKIVGGGFSGIANILYNTINFPPGLAVLLLNLAASLVCFRMLGIKFLIMSFITNALFSGFIQLFSMVEPFTSDLFASCILGGFFSGIGTALIMISGSTRGGSDIIARAVQSKHPSFKIGKFLLILDGLVILTGFLFFADKERVLFGIITLAIETTVLDYVITRLNGGNMLFVVTKKRDDVCKALVDMGKRGITTLDGSGGYTKREKGVIVTAIKDKETEMYYEVIRSIDEKAFIINLPIREVHGNGFKIYR